MIRGWLLEAVCWTLDQTMRVVRLQLRAAERLDAGRDAWDAAAELAPEVGWEVSQGCEGRVRVFGVARGVRRDA